MKVSSFPITSLIGGLNNRDRPSELRPDECADLENWLTDEGGIGHKRDGKDLIQYSPIQPTAYTVDGNTLSLWHLNEASPGPYIDSGSAGINLIDVFSITENVTGLFSDAIKFTRANGNYATGGTDVSKTGSAFTLNGKSACTYDAWIYIRDTYNGSPVLVNGKYISNSGVCIIANGKYSNSVGPSQRMLPGLNGLTLYRDWDFSQNKNYSDPYCKFTLQTSGVGGTVTTITSGAIPMNRWVHLRGRYNSTEAVMRLYINGALSASASPNGGGNVYDPPSGPGAGYGVFLGTGKSGIIIDPETGLNTGETISGRYTSFDGILEEVRISDIDRGEAFPFKKPRGKGFELAKNDGTRQEIVSAEEFLFYTIGDGAWSPVAIANPDGTALSTTDDWDAIHLGEKLYLSNGIDQPLVWDGERAVHWGEGGSPLGLTISGNVATSLSAGTYKYTYTYVYEDGETGPAPYAQKDVGNNDQVTISNIPTKHSNCESIRIYRTQAGGDIYYLIREIANDPNVNSLDLDGAFVGNGAPGEDSGKDGLADAVMIADADYILMTGTVQNTSIKKFRYLAANFNRIFGTGVGDREFDVFFSEFSPDVFKAQNFIRAKADKGPITGITNYESEVHASKSGNATLVLRGDNPNTWSQFETLHATIGCIDHWGYVLRTIPGEAGGTDRTILCFPARDGFYGYSGADFFKISDKILTTVQGLGAVNATRAEYTLTTMNDWMRQENLSGSATQNIKTPRYEQDGLREEPGKIKFVNQLDYIGLWNDQGALVPGKIIAICKGPAEGEFFFSTDANRNLYRTLDNFVTLDGGIALTNLDAITGSPVLVTDDHRIIEIVYASIGGEDIYWCLTSDSSEKGYLAKWNQSSSLWENSATVYPNGPYYWQGDTAWKLVSRTGNQYSVPNTQASETGYKYFYSTGHGGEVPTLSGDGPPVSYTGTAFQPTNGYNFHINHDQNIFITPSLSSSDVGVNIFNQSSINSSDSVFGYINSSNFNIRNVLVLSNYPTQTSGIISSGFHSISDDGSFHNSSVTIGGHENSWLFKSTGGYDVSLTRRETAFWKGGTFRPQMFWDSINNKLYFVGSSSEDVFGNRVTRIYKVYDPAIYNASAFLSLSGSVCMASDGTNCYITYTRTTPDSTTGFITRFGYFNLASGTYVAEIDLIKKNYLITRLEFNNDKTKILAVGKFFVNGELNDTWTYQGFFGYLFTSGDDLIILKKTTANGASGAYPAEISTQTTSPYSQFVIMQNTQSGDSNYIYSVDSSVSEVSIFKSDSYVGFNSGSATNGIRSNLVFAPSSGINGDYKWSDRLYWFGDAVAGNDSRMIQLGVPGEWEVRGTYEAGHHNIGIFDSFDTLITEFVGPQVDFSMRYGEDEATLISNDYLPQAANRKILGLIVGEVVAVGKNGGWEQWKADMIWRYSVAAPTLSPEISYVTIGYFLGNPLIPRIVGVHYNSRTYWAVATSGSTENDLILIYQKNNTWTKYTGWPVKGFNIFRNQLVGLEDYAFMRYEVGPTDAGNLIKTKILMGAVMNSRVDKMINDVKANVTTFVNREFVNKNGYMTLTPVMGGIPQTDNAWSFPIPDDVDTLPRQVQALPTNGIFTDKWIRSFQLLLETSKETSGSYVPFVGQREDIQAIILEVWETEDNYAMDVE